MVKDTAASCRESSSLLGRWGFRGVDPHSLGARRRPGEAAREAFRVGRRSVAVAIRLRRAKSSGRAEAVELHLADEDLEAIGLSPDPTIIVTIELTPEHA